MSAAQSSQRFYDNKIVNSVKRKNWKPWGICLEGYAAPHHLSI